MRAVKIEWWEEGDREVRRLQSEVDKYVPRIGEAVVFNDHAGSANVLFRVKDVCWVREMDWTVQVILEEE